MSALELNSYSDTANPAILVSADASTEQPVSVAENGFNEGRRRSSGNELQIYPSGEVRRRHSLVPAGDASSVLAQPSVSSWDEEIKADETNNGMELNGSSIWSGLPRRDSIGSFRSDIMEQSGANEISQTIAERVHRLVQRFVTRTQRFKEKTIQPPTPSSSASIDVVSAVSGVSEADAPNRQHRLDSFVPFGTNGTGANDLEDPTKQMIGCGSCRIKIPRVLFKLRPKHYIDSSSNFYLAWLFIGSVAFVYNCVAPPLRTAFKRAPIYNASGTNPYASPFPEYLLPTTPVDDILPTTPDPSQYSTQNNPLSSKSSSRYTSSTPYDTHTPSPSNASPYTQTPDAFSQNVTIYTTISTFFENQSFFGNSLDYNNTGPLSQANFSSDYFSNTITESSPLYLTNSTTSTADDTTTQTPGPQLIGYFPGYDTDETRIYWWILDYICDFIYIVDIAFVKSRLAFHRNGILETNSLEIRRNYMSNANFKMDLFALLPLDLLYFIPAINFCPMVRLPRLLKVQTFWEFYDKLDKAVSSAYFVRVARFLSYMVYMIHLETCGLYAVSVYIGIGTDGWVWDGTGIAYIHCMYLATKTATSIGNNVQPNTQLEYMFITFYWLAGVFVFAMLIGQIRDIFHAADANHDRYRKAFDQTTYYMKSMNVPKELQTRVKMWFTYNWEHSKTLDENSLLEALPKKMRTDLAIHVHFHTLSKVNLFQDCDKNLLFDLVLKLKPVLFLPGDYICRKGEVGTEMYIVMMGHIEVVGGPNNSIVFATLKEGSVFGEISLLALAGGNRRTADVRSKGYSQLFLLSKADFEEAMSDYPEAQKILRKKAKKLLSQNAKHHAKNPTEEVEEVIQSRQGTPKLLKTVIKVVNEDSNIPDYLGVRRKSSNKTEGEKSQLENMSDVVPEAIKVDQDLMSKYDNEYLIVETTETTLETGEKVAPVSGAINPEGLEGASDQARPQENRRNSNGSLGSILSLTKPSSPTDEKFDSDEPDSDENSLIREILSSPPPSGKRLRRTKPGQVFTDKELPPK